MNNSVDNNSKKIAIITKHHPEASLCLAIHLAKKGHEVDFYTIVTLTQKTFPGFEFPTAPTKIGIVGLNETHIPEIYKMAKGLRVRFHLIRVLSVKRWTRFIDALITECAIKIIKKRGYDAYNVIGQTTHVDRIHKVLRKENIIHTFHEVGFHYRDIPSTPFVNLAIKDSSKVILPSNLTLSRFQSLPQASNCRAVKIPVGMHLTILSYEHPIKMEIPLDLSKPTFLFYGRIVQYKGLSTLRCALELLKDRENQYNVIIAGAGADDNLSSLRVQKNVFILNRRISNDEMIYLNRICTAVLMPYTSASQSGIVLTTFMFGKPIIATKVGALIETISDKVNGLLVDKENPQAFADAMTKLIESPELVEKLSEGALKFGHGDEYDWDEIAQKTADFYFS